MIMNEEEAVNWRGHGKSWRRGIGEVGGEVYGRGWREEGESDIKSIIKLTKTFRITSFLPYMESFFKKT